MDAITWTLNLDVSAPTLQRTIRDAITYSKYVSALKEFLTEPLKEKRREWAKIMYAKYRNPEDWDWIRFSDEVYAGYSPEGHLWIARKRGKAMRYRWDNIQYRDPPPRKAAPPGYIHRRQLGIISRQNL